jgi:hypothetical protein
VIKIIKIKSNSKQFEIHGEARKYMKTDYEPQFPVSFENLKTTNEIDAIIQRYRHKVKQIQIMILQTLMLILKIPMIMY